ncbi:hypothetical protein EJB05_29672, partial [Eragrostis curvula]
MGPRQQVTWRCWLWNVMNACLLLGRRTWTSWLWRSLELRRSSRGRSHAAGWRGRPWQWKRRRRTHRGDGSTSDPLGARRLDDDRRRRWPLVPRRKCVCDRDGLIRRWHRLLGERGGFLARRGFGTSVGRHVDPAEYALLVADDGVRAAAGARVLLHEPVRELAVLELVPELRDLADLDAAVVLDFLALLEAPGPLSGAAHVPFAGLALLLPLDGGEEEAVVLAWRGAELGREDAGSAGVDVGVVDEGADGGVHGLAGEEARQ